MLATDPKNCGACKNDCAGGTCTAGACGPVELTQDSSATVWDVAVDNSYVYWSNYQGWIKRVPKAGGTPTVVVDNQPQLYNFIISSGDLYWVTCNSSASSIRMTPTGGGVVTTFATNQNGACDGISLSGLTLYWTNTTDGTLMSVSTYGSSTPKTVLSGLASPRALAVSGGQVWWIEGSGPGATAVAKLQGSTRQEIASGQDDAKRIILGSLSTAYWTNHYGGTVMRGQSGSAPVALSTYTGNPFDLVAGNQVLYFTDDNAGKVLRIPIDGGPATEIATGQAQPKGIALDNNFVYWANNGDGRIMKVAR